MIELVVPFSASGGSVVSVNGKMGVVVLTPEDIGALPNGALEGYATEQYVQEQIENIEHPTTDLTGYATETYVNTKIAEAQLSGEDVDLSAYATKQYVSEQVNAIELMPGPAGPQGPKGQDGYTPVKGVDYFDGQPGKDGADGAPGADGYTPVKGVDYFDGEDYVLTDADKQEIAGMVEVSGGDADLSDYYTKSEVDELIEAIPSTPGTGGSVNIDNATIIEEDGVIKTAVGGYIGTGPEQLYYWADKNGIASDSSGKITIDTVGVSNAATIFPEAMDGTRVINYKLTHAASAGGEITVYEGTGKVYSASGGYRYTLDKGIGSSTTVHVYAIGEAFVYMWLDGVLYSFEFYTPDVPKAIPIDNAFIDTEYVATKEYVATNYYTKEEVEALITSSIPASGEEVSY